MLSYRDVFDLRHAQDVQISPDGRSVAYVRVESDIRTDGSRRSIWLVDVASGRERLLIAATSSPRWSPDGARLAFAARDGGLATIRTINILSGAMQTVTRLPGSPSSLTWSPDGRAIAFRSFVEERAPAFVAPVAKPADATWASPPHIVTSLVYQEDGERFGTPGHVRLFVVPAAGGVARQLTEGKTNVDGDPVWTRDGRRLLFTGNTGEAIGNSYGYDRILAVPVSGGKPSAITPPELGAHDPALSPDGTLLAFAASRPNDHDYQQSSLFIMALETGKASELTPALDREVSAPRFAPDGKSVLFLYGDHGHQMLSRRFLAGEQHVLLRDLADDEAYSLADDGTVAFSTASATRPADAAVLAPGGTVRRITALNEQLLAGKLLADTERLTFRSPADGAEVGAWLTSPMHKDGGRPLPLILSIHGGPHGFETPSWSTQDQLWAAAGYAVLRVDYRGSLSYGFAFADRIARNFPGIAYYDLMGGVDAAIAKGLADPERLFVTGGSAGGKLTAWIVGRTHRFKAAVAVKPVINEVSQSLTGVLYGGLKDNYGAYPWEDVGSFWRQSPLSLVGNVNTPTMLMVGEQDHNTPANEAEQFYDALQLLKVPSALVIVPDAGHGSIEATPSRLIASTAMSLDWFARHGGAPVPATWKRD